MVNLIEYPDMSRRTIDIITSLKKLKAKYPYWNFWIKSEACFISENERKVLDSYLRYGSHKLYIEKSGKALNTCNGIIRNVERKLTNKYFMYEDWEKAISNEYIQANKINNQKHNR